MNDSGYRKTIHYRIFYFCLMGISFFLPVFPRVVPPFIALMTINWLIEAPFVKNFRQVFRERERTLLLAFSLLYLVYLICFFYSENQKYGREDLETKLSLLIFPLIFSTLDRSSITPKDGFHTLFFFVAGCFTGSLLLMGHSWYNETWNHISGSFYYGNLSWFFHSTYLSMYLAFSIAIIAWYIIFRNIKLKAIYKILLLLLAIYFLVMIILLSSKAGLASLILVMVFFSLLLIFKLRNWLTGMTFLVTSMLILYLGLQFFPMASMRISNAGKSIAGTHLKNSKNESTNERIEIWKSGWEIIRKNPIFGTGTGDVKDDLLLQYQKNNIQPAYEKKLNAHNQYIQTFIATGLPGILILVCMLLLPALSSIRGEHYLYGIFLIIFAMNITFESMLENQAGVVFYAFFNTFFFWIRKWKSTETKP